MFFVSREVKCAVKFVNDFEKTASHIAIEKKYQYVVCGHIHHPQIRTVVSDKGRTEYMNCGDWVENLTALEYDGSQWSIYRYREDKVAQSVKLHGPVLKDLDDDLIFKDLVARFLTVKG